MRSKLKNMINILALGVLASTTSFADDNTNILKQIQQQMTNSFNYWQISATSPDSYLNKTMSYINQWLNAKQVNAGFRNNLENYKKNISQQQINANTLAIDSKSGASSTSPSPSDSIKMYSPSQPGEDLVLSALESPITVDVSGSKKLSALVCSNAYFGGKSSDTIGNYNPTLSDASSGDITCRYAPALSNAVSFINHIANNNTAIAPGLSGDAESMKKAQKDSPEYESIVKNAIAAKNVGVGTLFNILQSNLGGAADKSAQRSEFRSQSPQWHAKMQAATPSELMREQTMMMADIEAELSTLIRLQRQQLAVSAANEIQNANTATGQKLGPIQIKATSNKITASLPKQ